MLLSEKNVDHIKNDEYNSPWLYKGEPIYEIDPKYTGFVYLIENLQNGKRYIGKKLAKFRKTKTVKGKKKRSSVESDWRTYWSSSKDVQEDVKTLGADKFKREILMFCLSKGTANYYEAKYQFVYEVLEKPDEWYNGQIQCRVHRSHIKIEK